MKTTSRSGGSGGSSAREVRLLTAVAALSVLATPYLARAQTCVHVDEPRDSLTADERRSAQTLFEDTLTENHVAVSRADCSESWTLYHVRLGETVTVTVRSPRGVRHQSVRHIEELSAAYSQIVKSLLAGQPISAEGTSIDRHNVTDTQTVNNRVAVDSLWYVRLGYGAMLGRGYHGGPSFGFGRRWELDRFGIDLSALNLTVYQGSDGVSGAGGSIVRLGGEYFLQPVANHTAYFGAGLGYGTNSFSITGDRRFSGNGLEASLSAGYEFFRASSLRVFIEANASLPIYRVDSTKYDVSGVASTEHAWTPLMTLSLGLGWGRARPEIAVTQR